MSVYVVSLDSLCRWQPSSSRSTKIELGSYPVRKQHTHPSHTRRRRNRFIMTHDSYKILQHKN